MKNNVYVCIIESFCCTVEINTTLSINYTKIYFKKYVPQRHTDHIFIYAAAAAKSLQSCPTLCDPTDGSPPGSCVHGILQARTLLLQTLPSFPGLTGASALFDHYFTDEETGLECENNSSKSAHHVRSQEVFEPRTVCSSHYTSCPPFSP